jgi:hypothetical protein
VLSVAYNSDPGLTRTSDYHIPIVPSADGLRYTLEHRFVCSAATQTVNVSVDYTTNYAGGGTVWVNIYAQNVTSDGTGGNLTTAVHADKTIPANAVALRVTYTAPAAGTRTDHHLLVYPSPPDATTGLQASGFVPFDDTLMVSGEQAAVHTEWVNRCKSSAVALLQDRRQCALAFVQEYRTTPRMTLTDKQVFRAVTHGRVWFPFQKTDALSLRVVVIAAVSAGATADLVRVRQVGPTGAASKTFDADGNDNAETLVCVVEGANELCHVDLEVAIKTTAGNTTRPFAVVAFWQPGG